MPDDAISTSCIFKHFRGNFSRKRPFVLPVTVLRPQGNIRVHDHFTDIAETRNKAEQTAFQYRKILDDVRDKIAADKVATVEAAIKEVEDAVEKDDYELMKTKLDELNKVFSEVSQEMYANVAQQQAQEAGGPEVGDSGDGGQGGSTSAADAVDADYTILEDEE